MSCRIATMISPFSRAFSSFLNALSFVAFIIFFFSPLFSSTFFYRSFPLRGVILYYEEENEVNNEGKGLIMIYCSLFYEIGWWNVCSNLLILKVCFFSLSAFREKVCYLFLRYVVINYL